MRYSRRPVSGPRGGCGRPAGIAFGIDQIELVFDRDDGRESERAKSLELVFEDAAWIAKESCAAVLEHAQLHLRDVALPRHGDKSPGNRHAWPIRVAVIEAEASRLNRAALDVEREHRAGQGHAACEHRGDTRAVDPLAALDGVQIVHIRVDEPDLRIIGQEALELTDAGAGHNGLSVYYFRRRFSGGRLSICPGAAGRQTGKNPELSPFAAAFAPAIPLLRDRSSCGLMTTLARVAGEGS